MTDETIEINVRPGDEVAARLLALVAISRRGFMDLDPELVLDDDDPDAEGERFDHLAWLAESRADRALTGRERALLAAEVGSLDPAEAVTATWEIEALAALAEACGLVDPSPNPASPADASTLLAALPSPPDVEREFAASLHLPGDEAAAALLERAEVLTFRLGAEIEKRETENPQAGAELRAAIRDVIDESRDAGYLPADAADFAINGIPVAQLPDQYLDEAFGVAERRAMALAWLCGFGDDWDSVTL